LNVGFVGTGNMGGVLVQALLNSAALKPEQVTVHNRTPAKAERLAGLHPGIRVARSAAEAAADRDILFICVKPLEYKAVLDEIAPVAKRETIVVSIASPVLIRHLEQKLECKIAKVIPSITNFIRGGAALCMYGCRMAERDIECIETLLRAISAPLRIEERHVRITSDISSIGPAFLAFFLQQFIDAAVGKTGISREEATRLAAEMTLGTGRLLTEGGFSPESLQERVCVPGGITEKALSLLRSRVDGMFTEVIEATHRKYEEDLTKVKAMLGH